MKPNILHELFKDAAQNFSLERFAQEIPSLHALKTTPQDAIYHAEGNVWIHTEMVCNELLSNPTYQKSNGIDKFIMFYAALLHDIGKPYTTVTEDTGRITSKGHSPAGSVDTRVILWENDIDFQTREEICNIIKYHQYPFYLLEQNNYVFSLHKLSQFLTLQNLFLVAESDIRGRITDSKQNIIDKIELTKEISLEENCLYNRKDIPPEVLYEYFNKNGRVPEHALTHLKTKSNVIVMAGLPAAGKDTWVEQKYSELPVISFDNTRKKLKLKYGDNEGQVIHSTIDEAKQLLRNGTDFVWNATHLTKKNREKTFSLISQYHGKISVDYLEHDKKTILSRNNNRDSSLSNEKLIKMLRKWDVLTPIEAHNVNYHPMQFENIVAKPFDKPKH